MLNLGKRRENAKKPEKSFVNLSGGDGVVSGANSEDDLKPRKRRTVLTREGWIVNDAIQIGKERLK
jgi:hypothetical protein